MYVGNFENDLQHGYGEEYVDGVQVFKGYWINGEMVDENGFPIIEEEKEEVLPEKKNNKKKAKFSKSPPPKITTQRGNHKSPVMKNHNQTVKNETFVRRCGCSK